MKKSILYAALVCSLVACQTRLEEEYEGSTSIFATLEDNTTKAVLSPGQSGVSSILWSEADELAVFLDGNSQATSFKLLEGAGTKQAVFKGTGSGSKYVAFYPFRFVSSLSGDNVRINFPVEQRYEEGTFANGAFPMLASGTSPNLTFSNIASILRLSITGKHKVTRIVFRSAQSSIKVCGQATASVANKQLSITSNGRDSLVLTVPGVQLSETQPTDFYLVLPPQTYKGGFTVRVYTDDRYMDQTLTSDFTLVRSQMHKADPFVFKPNGIDVSTTLKGSGTEVEPFLIESLEDFLLMREAVNSAETINGVAAVEAVFKLTADIDLSPVCGAASKKSWTPIGSSASAFMGTFDGGGHVIRNLFISSNEKWQGLFGLVGSSDYQIHKGIIRDLTVVGDVKAGDHVGLIAGEVGRIEYCSAKGKVEGINYNSFSGGLVGSAHNILFCRNEASVKGVCFVGGLAGDSSAEVRNCVNGGDVTATTSYSGGILGYQNLGILYNCVNEGEIRGSVYVGGIAGYNRQGAQSANCINKGNVIGTDDNTGGIIGCVDYPAYLFNCVNVGKVTCNYDSSWGGICGYNNGVVQQNYWLFEQGQGMEKGIGHEGEYGSSSANRSLSSAQMKGADYGEPLFKSYSLLLDALNGWAAQNKTTPRPYSGWQFIQEGTYPSLTNMDAQFPGEQKAVFQVSTTSVEVSDAYRGGFELSVTSSLEYETSLPEWISLVSERGFELDPNTKLYSYSVGPNETGLERRGEIVFTNSEGTSKTVRVKQVPIFLACDASEIAFSASGGIRRFKITSSIPWTVQSNASWCIASPDSGTGDATVAIRTEVNENEAARSASVRVASVDGSISYSIAVAQGGKMPDDGKEADWKEYPFVHQSVAMRFTATWCGWCPMMNKSIKRAQELYPGHIQQIALHEGSSDLRFSRVNPLISQFSITGYPTGVIDGRMLVGNMEIESAARMMVDYVKETETTYGTVSGVEIMSSLSGREASVSVGVYLKKAGDYKITVLLLEDDIINPQSDNVDGYNAQYVHDCVARVAMTDVLGDTFGSASDFSVQRFNYAATIPNGYDVNNMRVMVYIQRAYGSYPIKQNGSFGNYFIDNCATVDLGNSLKLALEGGSSGGGGGSSGDDNEGITPGGEIDM